MSQEIKLRIACEAFGEVEAVITEKNPRTASAIREALPFEGVANVWGEEIYFSTPVKLQEENPQQDMDVGDIAFWPIGSAMCVFFGPTPVSESEKPRAYSPVNLFARVLGDAKVFRKVRDGDTILVKHL